MNIIGSRIKILVDIISKGNTSDFARQIDVNEANIRKYIQGSTPKADTLEKIVKKFDVNAYWLLIGEGNIFTNSRGDAVVSTTNENTPIEMDVRYSYASELERITKIIEWLIYSKKVNSKKDFASKLGYAESYISQILTGKVKLSDKFINSLSIFPEINIEWIYSGNGQMLLNCDTTLNDKYSELPNKNLVKLYGISASAGFFETYNSSDNVIDEIYLPNMPSADGAIFARGESMSPVINNGDIVAFRMLQKNSPICWGEIYIISYTINGDYFTCIKRLHKVDDKVRLVSINENYSPVDIPKESITHIALVVFSLNINKYAY